VLCVAAEVVAQELDLAARENVRRQHLLKSQLRQKSSTHLLTNVLANPNVPRRAYLAIPEAVLKSHLPLKWHLVLKSGNGEHTRSYLPGTI
jgi:hypothetical protein